MTSAGTFLRLLYSAGGSRVGVYFVLNCLLGLINGVGLLMLIPLLELVGVGGDPSGISRVFASLLGVFGWSPSLEIVLVGFVAVVATHAVLARWVRIVKSDLELALARSLQSDLYAAITRADWSFFVRMRQADFTHALTSNLERVATGTFYFLRLLAAALITSVHVILAVAISPLMAATCLGCFLLLWKTLGRQNRAAMRTGQQVTELTEDFYADISDCLAGMKEVKSLGAEAQHIQALNTATYRIAHAWHAYTRTAESTTLVYTVGSAGLMAGMLYMAVGWLRIPLTELMVLILVFSRLVPRLRDLHVSYQQILHSLPALASAVDLQNRCDEAREAGTRLSAGELRPERAIEFDQVSYQYKVDTADWALCDINLTIPVGGTTAIVGPSGAGKSTLADLLLGLLVPSEGAILVDGRPLGPENRFAWRQNIGYVPQTTFLLHDTVRRNLIWGLQGAGEDEIRRALRLAQAEQFVHALPNGLDTVVGDRGVRLSGGQRQRIAMARALLRRPAVLILDEATSNLDTDNELRIQQAIQELQGELTVVIVAHRLSTIRHADQVAFLSGGQLLECGSFAALAELPRGRFRQWMAAEESVTRKLAVAGARV